MWFPFWCELSVCSPSLLPVQKWLLTFAGVKAGSWPQPTSTAHFPQGQRSLHAACVLGHNVNEASRKSWQCVEGVRAMIMSQLIGISRLKTTNHTQTHHQPCWMKTLRRSLSTHSLCCWLYVTLMHTIVPPVAVYH